LSRSTIIEEQPEVQSDEKDNSDSILNSIISTDKELKRLLHEKQMLLSRLLNIPQDAFIPSIHSIKPNSSLEAITYATTYRKSFKKSSFYVFFSIILFR
jgi:hypothetical protein